MGCDTRYKHATANRFHTTDQEEYTFRQNWAQEIQNLRTIITKAPGRAAEGRARYKSRRIIQVSYKHTAATGDIGVWGVGVGVEIKGEIKVVRCSRGSLMCLQICFIPHFCVL